MATAGTTEVKAIFNDTENWHFVAKRYQPDRITNSDYENMIVLDPLYNDELVWIKTDGSKDEKRPQELAGETADAPLSISSKSVTIGGAIKFTVDYIIYTDTKTVNYVGDLDEVMIINRMMTKRELARLYKTGETYIYPVNTLTFSGADCWSSSEGNFKPVPGALTGAAYIVDNGKTMTQNATATFGGDVSKKISLTLGRLAELTYHEGTTTKTVTTVGNFSQGVGSAITFYDLRLNDGTYAAGGTSLTTTLLDVDAPPSKPFALSAAGDFALNVGEDTTGSGVLAKTGAGKLTVSKWAGTAKLRMTAGSIKTPRLDGYTGGKVLVNTTTPVVFTGTDVLEKPMQIEVENPPTAAGTYTLMTVPSGSVATSFDNSAQSYGNLAGTLSVDGTALKLTLKLPFPDADKGEVPVLIGQ